MTDGGTLRRARHIYFIGRAFFAAGILALSALGCSLFTQPAPPTPTPYQVVIILPNESPVPTPTPSDTPTPSLTPTASATATGTATPTATPTITPTPSITLTPSVTLTPSITPTPAPIDSQVCVTCRVRLRESPGTAGRFMDWLDENVSFRATGRTEDGQWIEVTLTNDPKNRAGWLFIGLTALRDTDVSMLPVTGTAIDASPTPTYVVGGPQPISNVTSKSREIFVRGQALGNRANVFTRIGDSLTASPYFLTPIGLGNYDLGPYHNELIDVVGFFLSSNAYGGANAFLHASLAAGNGWGADRLLQPGYSHPDVCGADSPIVCEYRLVKPSVALIMIGTNDSGGVAPAEFEGNLRRIVEISIEMGVIPVLTTIPPKLNDSWNGQRAVEFNGIIRMLAAQYDVPLSDYWSALQTAPNYGLSSDGIHPSAPPNNAACKLTPENLAYGYTLQNLTALRALDSVWRLVMY